MLFRPLFPFRSDETWASQAPADEDSAPEEGGATACGDSGSLNEGEKQLPGQSLPLTHLVNGRTLNVHSPKSPMFLPLVKNCLVCTIAILHSLPAILLLLLHSHFSRPDFLALQEGALGELECVRRLVETQLGWASVSVQVLGSCQLL